MHTKFAKFSNLSSLTNLIYRTLGRVIVNAIYTKNMRVRVNIKNKI